jgi:L-amino acid N-acyltransferase YncA
MMIDALRAYDEQMSSPEYTLHQPRDRDRDRIVEIFNHYIIGSFAAYPAEPISPKFMDILLRDAFSLYVAEHDGEVVGFGYLKPFLPFSTFMTAATVTYFIVPEHTRSGLGTRMLEALESDARQRGVRTLLANIASPNVGSLEFHRKHGFSECGRLPGVGVKFGERFDVVWMVKSLES